MRTGLAAEGRPRSIRFRTPDEGASHFVDLIRGEVRVDWDTIHDFVIVRSDGNPIFFLANAVDDMEMEITHVIRGEDLLDSTHRVLALRAALGGGPPPEYAHLPLIVGPDRAKLSKRHGAVALEDFRDAGYLPEALCNYLALLGWAPEDGREVMDADELCAAFDLDRVTHAAAAFDHKKLDWINGEWIRRITLRELEARALPIARERFGDRLDLDVFSAAARIGQERAVTLVALVDQTDFLFVADDDFEIEPESWNKVVATERVSEILDAVITHLETCEWTVEAIDVRPVVDALGVKPRKAMPALYAAVEGRHAGLPLFDSIELLGRERALARLRAARIAASREPELMLLATWLTWKLVRRVLYVLVALVVAYYLVTVVQVWRAARSDDTRHVAGDHRAGGRAVQRATDRGVPRPARPRRGPLPAWGGADGRRDRRQAARRQVHRSRSGCRLPAREGCAGRRDPARDDRAFLVGVARRVGPVPAAARHPARRARVRPVPLPPDPPHRGRARLRRRDVADADEPDRRLRRVEAVLRRGVAGRGRPDLRLRPPRPGDCEVGAARPGVAILGGPSGVV